MSLIAVVDLGGTKIQTLLVNASLQVLAEDRRPSAPELGPDSVLRNIVASIEAARASIPGVGALRAIGIAAAGTIDPQTGAADSVNLPHWRGMPIVAPIQQAFGCETILENDCTAAAWGEYVLGAGRSARHMVYLSLGTGVGGGLVLDGQLFRGHSGAAGELGHIPLDPTGVVCGCGSAGCLEQLASGTAIARQGAALVRNGQSAALAQLAGNDRVTSEMVYDAANAGDSASVQIIRTAGIWLGRGLVALVNIFNPDCVVLGGGVAQMGPLLLDPARAEVATRAMRPAGDAVTIVRAELGDRAGALGLAAMIVGRR